MLILNRLNQVKDRAHVRNHRDTFDPENVCALPRVFIKCKHVGFGIYHVKDSHNRGNKNQRNMDKFYRDYIYCYSMNYTFCLKSFGKFQARRIFFAFHVCLLFYNLHEISNNIY